MSHVAVAFDNPIRSFRNELFAGYKPRRASTAELSRSSPSVEEALARAGRVVWSMKDFEADDALATAAARFLPETSQVRLLTPDKDLSQCVVGERVCRWTAARARAGRGRRVKNVRRAPRACRTCSRWWAIAADGIPGRPGVGEKGATALLSALRPPGGHPPRPLALGRRRARRRQAGRGPQRAGRAGAPVPRSRATVRAEPALFTTVDELRWAGPTPAFEAVAERLNRPQLVSRAKALAKRSMAD